MTTTERIPLSVARPPTAAPRVAITGGNGPSTPERTVVRSNLSPTISAIVEELQRSFFGVLPAATVAQCASKAVQDLLGSICLQALPEMAIRLATVRLDTARLDTTAIDTAPLDTELVEPTAHSADR